MKRVLAISTICAASLLLVGCKTSAITFALDAVVAAEEILVPTLGNYDATTAADVTKYLDAAIPDVSCATAALTGAVTEVTITEALACFNNLMTITGISPKARTVLMSVQVAIDAAVTILRWNSPGSKKLGEAHSRKVTVNGKQVDVTVKLPLSAPDRAKVLKVGARNAALLAKLHGK